MNKIIMAAALFFTMISPAGTHAAGQTDCTALKNIFQTDVESDHGICKVEIVRKSPNVTHIENKLSPETMELVFHLVFEEVHGKTAVIGEFALLQEEVNPVIDELRKGNIDISALHNHMLFEEPRIMYLHFQGTGDLKQQAEAIQKAIAKTSK